MAEYHDVLAPCIKECNCKFMIIKLLSSNFFHMRYYNKKTLASLVGIYTMAQQVEQSFHCIRDEYTRWRAILEEPYREFAAIK